MRALVKSQRDLIRVENPPISNITPVVESGVHYLLVKIRFAFDAIQVAAGLGRTVRLQLKTAVNPPLRHLLTDGGVRIAPSFSSVTQIERDHVKFLGDSLKKTFDFDLLKSLPDNAIPRLALGNPISYQYVRAVTAPNTQRVDTVKQISAKEYLVSKIMSGIDPATLRESFPSPDPVKSSRSETSLINGDGYFTRSAERPTSYQKMIKLSKFAIFEEEVKIKASDFISAKVYEFSFNDFTDTPLETVEVSVDTIELYTQLRKLQYTSVDGIDLNYSISSSAPRETAFTRLIRSANSLTTSEYSSSPGASSAKVPKIIRTLYQSADGIYYTPKFESRVEGLPSVLNKVTNSTTLNKPYEMPFYVDSTASGVYLRLPSLPALSSRVIVYAKNLTRYESDFREIATAALRGKSSAEVLLEELQTDCVYEIKVSITSTMKKTSLSANSIVYDNKSPNKSFRLTVGSPALLGDQRVKFDVTADFTESGRQDITALIDKARASGVSLATLSEYISSSQFYSEVFSYRVEKINLDTGAQTFFEERAAGKAADEFIDQRLDNQHGAVYIFSLGAVTPGSLIPEQQDYKWGRFGGTPLRSLPSERTLAEDFQKGADFSTIDTGIKKVVYVPNTTLRGAISNISLTKTVRESHLVEWTYSGDVTEVDHFQVLGSADGVECLLGCSFRSNSYEDTVLYDRVGVVKYSVRPVYLTMEIGETFSVSLTNASTLPTIVDDSFSNGQKWRIPVTATNATVKYDVAATSTPPRAAPPPPPPAREEPIYVPPPTPTVSVSTSASSTGVVDTPRSTSEADFGASTSSTRSSSTSSRSSPSTTEQSSPFTTERRSSSSRESFKRTTYPAAAFSSAAVPADYMVITPANSYSIEPTLQSNGSIANEIMRSAAIVEGNSRDIRETMNTNEIDGAGYSVASRMAVGNSYLTVQNGVEIYSQAVSIVQVEDMSQLATSAQRDYSARSAASTQNSAASYTVYRR